MNRNVDLAIAGGGIVALSIAWEWVRRDPTLKIALISPRADSSAASIAAGAMLSGYGETTHLSHSSEAGRAKIALRLASAAEWQSWVEQLSEAVGDVRVEPQRGTTIILNAVSGHIDQKNFAAIIELLEGRREPYSQLDSWRDLGWNGSMSDRPLQAIHIPSERYVDASAVLAALQVVIDRATNVQWHDAECTEVRPSAAGSGAYDVIFGDEKIQADKVVVAAGVSSLRTIEAQTDIVARIPMLLAGSGTAILCKDEKASSLLNHAIRTPNRAFACGLHALRRGDNRLYVGATNNVQLASAHQAILSDVAFLIDCAVHQIDRRIASARVSQILVGNRPIAIDTFPLIGETSLRGLWLVTGTYRDGFLMAPLIARRVVDAMARNRGCIEGGELFIPEREPLFSMDIDTAVEEAVANYVAIASERNTRLPAVGNWVDEFRAALERKVRIAYDSVGTSYVVPPEFLWDLEHGQLLRALQAYYQRTAAVWGVK